MRRILCTLALFCTILVGCASDRRSDTLTTTLSRYGSVVRWGDFATALAFVDPKVREEHPVSDMELSRYAQVRVSNYDDGSGPVPGDNPNEVRQVVQIGLVNVHTQSERNIVDRQLWRYDETTHKWWLVSGLPDISRD
jgi:hypothetical protein